MNIRESEMLSQKYRLKALACEKIARGTSIVELRDGWLEVAIEWHALASRVAREFGLDHSL
jgi:hypothetical protein